MPHGKMNLSVCKQFNFREAFTGNKKLSKYQGTKELFFCLLPGPHQQRVFSKVLENKSNFVFFVFFLCQKKKVSFHVTKVTSDLQRMFHWSKKFFFPFRRGKLLIRAHPPEEPNCRSHYIPP